MTFDRPTQTPWLSMRSNLSVLGLGCVWAWAWVFGGSSLWLTSDDPAFIHAAFSLIWVFLLPVTLAILALFKQRLARKPWKTGIVAVSLALCLAVAALYTFVWSNSLFADAPGAIASARTPSVLVAGVLFGSAWALQLCAWAQCACAQPRLVSIKKLASSFFIAGVLFFVVQADVLPRTLLVFALPLTASLCFFFCTRQQREPDAHRPQGTSEPPTATTATNKSPLQRLKGLKDGSVAGTHLYAALIGFVWSALPQSVMTITPIDSALGGLIAGVLFLFLVALLKDTLSIDLSLALVAILLCTSVLVTLLLPISGTYSPYLLTACFQSCYLLVLTKASEEGMRDESLAVAFICRDIALFVFSIALGSLVNSALNGYPIATMLLTAGVLITVLALMFKRRTMPNANDWREDWGETQASELAAAPNATPASLAQPKVALLSATTPISIEARCASLAQDTGLTAREHDVLVMLAKGHTLAHIADSLFLSQNTVKKHRGSLYLKLDIHKRQDLINLLSTNDPSIP